MAVPVFFMVTGALLLHKEEPLLLVLQKRVFRFLIVLLLIAVVQYGWFSRVTDIFMLCVARDWLLFW